MGSEEFDADEEGAASEALFGVGPKRNFPTAQHPGRDYLLPGLDHFFDLLADKGGI